MGDHEKWILKPEEQKLLHSKINKVNKLMQEIVKAKGSIKFAENDKKYIQFEKKRDEYQASLTKHENALLIKAKKDAEQAEKDAIEKQRQEEHEKIMKNAAKIKAEEKYAKLLADNQDDEMHGLRSGLSQEEKALQAVEEQAAAAKKALQKLASGEISPLVQPKKTATLGHDKKTLETKIKKLIGQMSHFEEGSDKYNTLLKEKEELEKELKAVEHDELLSDDAIMFSPTPDFQAVHFGSSDDDNAPALPFDSPKDSSSNNNNESSNGSSSYDSDNDDDNDNSSPPIKGLLKPDEIKLFVSKINKVKKLMQEIVKSKGSIKFAEKDKKYIQFEKKLDTYQASLTKHENALLIKAKRDTERAERRAAEQQRLKDQEEQLRNLAKARAQAKLKKRLAESEDLGESLHGARTQLSSENKALKEMEEQAAKAKKALEKLQSGELSPVSEPKKTSTLGHDKKTLETKLKKITEMMSHVEVGTDKYNELLKEKEEYEEEMKAVEHDELLMSPVMFLSPTPDFKPVCVGALGISTPW